MAEAQMLKNALAIGTAASWSDSTGFADTALLAIVDSSVVHTDLDTTGDTTNGIYYLHIRGGTPQIGPDAGHLKIEFDATYTSKDNFVFDTDGGHCYLEIVTNACNVLSISGFGTIHIYASGGGSAGTIAVSGNAQVYIYSTCDITSKLQASGNCYVWVEHKSADNIPTCEVSGNAFVDSERRVVTGSVTQSGRLDVDNQVGTAGTTLNQNGGATNPIRGDWATVNHNAGDVNEWAAKYSLTLGSTAYNINSAAIRIPTDTGLVTVSNKTRTFKTGAGAGV